jgi:hypothetical protein
MSTPAEAVPSPPPPSGLAQRLWRWFDRTFLELGREMRVSYLPPLMVYLAAGIQGLTGIAGTFIVKDYLGLSAAFLAALGFWAGIPWALKMPIGHCVDLMWRWKGWLVLFGALLLAASLGIMIGIVGYPDAMRTVMALDHWFVVAALLAPIGYVIQDAVADAMTVDAVPRVDESGNEVPPDERKLMHTTMQMLGRVAIIGGAVLVSGVNVWLFAGTESLPAAEKARIYLQLYWMALVIPIVSVAGVALAAVLAWRRASALRAKGFAADEVRRMLGGHVERPPVNWWVLGGGALFAAVAIGVGLSNLRYGQEIVFVASFAIVAVLMSRILKELSPDARRVLLGTAIVIFVFRAIPSLGPGPTWWTIDILKFDQAFIAKLGLISTTLTLAGMFLFRRFMAEHSIFYIVGWLTIVGTILTLPTLGMYYGLHEWTARMTGGVVDQRFIAVIDTALESPLGQIAMIPMLAWIASSAPERSKATFFAVMASFTNLALSASQLGAKYLNQLFTVTREVKDASGAVKVPQDYSQLGDLLLTGIVLGLVLPLVAIAVVRALELRSA